MTKIYEVQWYNPIDELVEKYNAIKNKKSKEAKELKIQINDLIEVEEKKVQRKMYTRP